MNRNNGYLPFLDGIRGIAIFVVFLFHSLGTSFGFDKLPWSGLFRDFDTSGSFLLLYPLTYGWAGVPIFFVVSGFCIHLSHQRSSDKGWACFFNRRFFRVYPAYLLAICVFFFVWPWGSLQMDSFNRFVQLGSHILAIHNLLDHSFFGINPSFWSIAVEIQLYMIYPLLLLLTKRLGWCKGLIFVGIIEIFIRAFESLHGIYSDEILPRFVTASPFAFWFSWSLGAYLSECFLAGRNSRLFLARFEIVAVVSFLLPLFKPTAPFAFLSFSLLTVIAIHRFATGQWRYPEVKDGVFCTCWSHLSSLGVVSYAFYLFHQPIIGLTGRVLRFATLEPFVHPLIKFSICMMWYPFIFLLSLSIFKYIEQPSIALGKTTWRRIKSRTRH